MGIFANTSLDPDNDPTTDVWPATVAEIKSRGLEVHGSLSRRNVEDGATAVVLKATETKSGRVVAIKIYKEPERKVGHRNGDTIPMSNFFENERRMLAGLQACPLVPKYYFSVGTEDATSGEVIQPFHVMEFVEGQRITQYVSESLGGDKQAMESLFREVLEAIDTIHQFGYLHRDLSDGNVLVDRQGKIRLIDLAEASPLGAEHTRLVTTPGFGTDGVATEEQRHIRKIQSDDVRDACTIGYAMFTGRWKRPDEKVGEWSQNLAKAGTRKGIAALIVKGMKPRDRNRRQDRSTWNSAREVIEAIDRLRRRRQTAKAWFRNALVLAAILAVVSVIGYFAWDRAQRIAYTSELSRLGKQRELLSNAPRSDRADARVQQRIDAAEELEGLAAIANRDGRVGEASYLLAKAVDEVSQASRFAENLSRLRPLIKPLRKILLDNDQWNRDCPAINRRLTELGNKHERIREEVESGDPEHAWPMIGAIQKPIVDLIDDNQQSFRIADLMRQVDAQSIGLDGSLKELTAYQQINNDCSRATEHYEEGKWSEARTELLGALASMKSFLAKHESDEQRENRVASNSEMVNAQRAANDSLRKQVKELSGRIAMAEEDYEKVLYDGAQFKKERDAANSQLITLRNELETAKANLESRRTDPRKVAEWAAQMDIPEVKLAAFGKRFTNSIGQTFVYVSAGRFEMGDEDEQDDETPHQVTLTQGFFVATTENTQGAWRTVMGTEPWKNESRFREGDAYPAVYVGANDADSFCVRLNELERKNGSLPVGWEYRLLTEAQWEYACRAGSTTKYHFGGPAQLSEFAWIEENTEYAGEDYPHEVGRKRPNQWGLFDMHGNVWEWTADVYAEYASRSVTDPLVESGGSERVHRGGSFLNKARTCRSANRWKDASDVRDCNVGFRIACVQSSQ